MTPQIEQFLKELNDASNTREKTKHIYAVCKYSASKIVEAMTEPFDKMGVALKTFNKHFDNPESIYYKKSVDEIIEMWEAKGNIGKSNGRILDKFIGMVLEHTSEPADLDKFIKSLPEVPAAKCRTFLNFYKTNIENKLEFLTREKILADESTGAQGRFDALFLSGDNLLVVDWKNTETITTSNSYSKMRGPLYKYDASNLNSYTVQVYLYVYILRKVYHLENIKLIPLIIQIGTSSHCVYSPIIPYSDKLVEDIIAYAADEINKQITE